jgi:AAA+ ATPase superfamily predicted ATPase
LIEYFRSAQNIVVQGERRIGKTSLIVETARKIKRERALLTVDLMAIKSAQDIYERIIKSVFKLERDDGFLNKLLKMLSHLRPVVGVDPNTNALTVSLDTSNRLSPTSLEEALDLVEKMNERKRLIVFFDEFQEVLTCSEQREILAILRSKIQYHENVAYVFAGSIRNRQNDVSVQAHVAGAAVSPAFSSIFSGSPPNSRTVSRKPRSTVDRRWGSAIAFFLFVY